MPDTIRRGKEHVEILLLCEICKLLNDHCTICINEDLNRQQLNQINYTETHFYLMRKDI